ncbi:MAG TPA: NAD(P)/FAD-dependent oxidoreductase [Sphingomonas sp.]|uniref:FAD-dependent oxidoreductase n=1 Tax=Sphingomonas sp. TaxID=28214 RepID=UPI002C881F70|nr:NAD(P)/FAD-dependent oxidoreductase [Sphingomonas sp.]HMI20159.1 NAD(P)/FAD-dependent oxidoreductase [Sphingomonas sp.]
MTSAPRIGIIGGGPGGLMLARLLQISGLAPVLLERDAHADERPQGGSLDLHGDTGLRAIRLAGLEEAFLAHARPEDQGDRLYDPDGNILFDHDGEGEERPEIDRSALRQILLDALVPGSVRWSSKVEAILPNGDGWRVVLDGEPQDFDIVVGADGAWSRVRPLLSDAQPLYEGITFIELGFDARLYPEVDELAGGGKMFAVGNNRALVAQRNGHQHIRGYAALRTPEEEARRLEALSADQVRTFMREAFAGWAPSLTRMIEVGELIAVRSIQALPIGHVWESRPGLTLLGDAAHLMSPFAGEGVNLALADAADLAEALTSGEGWSAVARYEAQMAERAKPAAEEAHMGAEVALSPDGAAPVLAHYRHRLEA